MRFRDCVCIITGSGGGIGLATAKLLASEGAHLVLADIDQQKLNQAEREIGEVHASEVITTLCDVSNEEEVIATVTATFDRFGTWDAVVNNAGLMTFRPLEELSGEDWLRILNVDLLGAFYFTKQAFLKMQTGGRIVNVSSIHAVETEPLVAPYAAAKAALLSLTRSASLEGKPKGIRVNAVLPGAIDTPMLWQNPNVKSGQEKIVSGDVGRPVDVANAIAYLISNEAEFVQGAALRVDGGRLGRL